MPDAEDFHGPSGVRAWFDKIGDTFSDVRWEAEEITDVGERLLVALKVAATGRTSGVAGEFRIFQAWTMRNGKLVRLESYLSRGDALEALGLRE